MVIKYIISAIILLLISYYVFRVIVRNDYLKKYKLSPVSWIAEFIVFALHANFMYLFLPTKWPNMPPLPENQTIKFVSMIFLLVGVIILLIAWFGLGTGTSFGQDKNKLKTKGIYQYSRNPQLVAYGFILISIIILYFSIYSIGWFILYLIVAYFMVNTEEEFLQIRYGDEYIEFCKSVPRIIGKL